VTQARGQPHRLFVGLQRPDPNYGPLELWDVQRRGPPVWSCAPDFGARGSICSLALADEVNTVVAGMSSGGMYIYDTRANKSRCAAELKHSSSFSGFPGVLAMQLLSDMRSFVAVGDSGSIDVWDTRFIQQPRHTAVVPAAALLTTVLGSRKHDRWPGIIGHSLFDPNIFIVGVDFDAGNCNDSMVLLMSTGAAIVVDMTKGFPLPESVVKPHVDLSRLGPHHVTSSRGDVSMRFGVAWGRQGGRRVFYMADNISPPPSTGQLQLSASHPGIYFFFPDNPKHSSPPPKLDPQQGMHWDDWWDRCRSRFPSATGSSIAAGVGAQSAAAAGMKDDDDSDTSHMPEGKREFLQDHSCGRQLRHLRLLKECNHVPLPPSNSRVISDNVIALAASHSFDLVAVATANGHVQTARARKAPSLTARNDSVGSAKSAMFCRGTLASWGDE
jgi:hypothetical protein